MANRHRCRLATQRQNARELWGGILPPHFHIAYKAGRFKFCVSEIGSGLLLSAILRSVLMWSKFLTTSCFPDLKIVEIFDNIKRVSKIATPMLPNSSAT